MKKMRISNLICSLYLLALSLGCTAQQTNTPEKEAFEKARQNNWLEVFSDSCTADWKEK